jgi:hypothetical protein
MLDNQDKIFINKKIEEGLNDYVVIANLLFKKENLNGRSKEAKLVRKYLIEVGLAKGSVTIRKPRKKKKSEK